MKTELLNEYIFADLIYKHAVRIAKERLDVNHGDIDVVTQDDLKEAFDHLLSLSNEVRSFVLNKEDGQFN